MAMLSRQPLFALSLLTVGLFPLGLPAQEKGAHSDPVPPQDAQHDFLAAMRRYSDSYIAKLPNFICDQVTRQFQAGKKPTHWHKGDTLISKLIFSNRREQRSVKLVNNRPVQPGSRSWRAPLTTEGEFGILLSNVLGSGSDATYRWNRWDVLAGKRLAVFNYSIDKQHSTLRLSRSDLARATVPYHGDLYADPDTGVVWRITNTADDIPPEIEIKSITTDVKYDEVPIAGHPYILPIRATILMDTGSSNVRNELEFDNYRKFEANSTVTYSSDDASNSSLAEPKPRF